MCMCNNIVDLLYYMFCCSRRYKCEICESRHRSRRQLREHIKYNHNEIFSFGQSSEFKNGQKLYDKINFGD